MSSRFPDPQMQRATAYHEVFTKALQTGLSPNKTSKSFFYALANQSQQDTITQELIRAAVRLNHEPLFRFLVRGKVKEIQSTQTINPHLIRECRGIWQQTVFCCAWRRTLKWVNILTSENLSFFPGWQDREQMFPILNSKTPFLPLTHRILELWTNVPIQDNEPESWLLEQAMRMTSGHWRYVRKTLLHQLLGSEYADAHPKAVGDLVFQYFGGQEHLEDDVVYTLYSDRTTALIPEISKRIPLATWPEALTRSETYFQNHVYYKNPRQTELDEDFIMGLLGVKAQLSKATIDAIFSTLQPSKIIPLIPKLHEQGQLPPNFFELCPDLLDCADIFSQYQEYVTARAILAYFEANGLETHDVEKFIPWFPDLAKYKARIMRNFFESQDVVLNTESRKLLQILKPFWTPSAVLYWRAFKNKREDPIPAFKEIQQTKYPLRKRTFTSQTAQSRIPEDVRKIIIQQFEKASAKLQKPKDLQLDCQLELA